LLLHLFFYLGNGFLVGMLFLLSEIGEISIQKFLDAWFGISVFGMVLFSVIYIPIMVYLASRYRIKD